MWRDLRFASVAFFICSLSHSAPVVPNACFEAKELASDSADQVTQPVPGLYDAIPYSGGTQELGPLTLKDRKGPAGVTTQVSYIDPVDHIEVKGTFQTDLRPIREEGGSSSGKKSPKELLLIAQFLNTAQRRDGSQATIPKWLDLPKVPALVPGKGIPTFLAIALRDAKRLGVTYGDPSIERAHLSQIRNFETVVQIARLRREWQRAHPKELFTTTVMAEMYEKTRNYRQMETILTQLGLRVTGIEVIGETSSRARASGKKGSASSDLPKREELTFHDLESVLESSAEDHEAFGRLLKQNGLTWTDLGPVDFDVSLSVKPR